MPNIIFSAQEDIKIIIGCFKFKDLHILKIDFCIMFIIICKTHLLTSNSDEQYMILNPKTSCQYVYMKCYILSKPKISATICIKLFHCFYKLFCISRLFIVYHTLNL